MSKTSLPSESMSSDPYSASITAQFASMLGSQPDFLAGVLGGIPLGDGPPPVVEVGDFADGMSADVSMDGDVVSVLPVSYEEDRGAFVASYTVIGPVQTAMSEVQVKGFLIADEAIVEQVSSRTDETVSMSPGGIDVTMYEASVVDGVASETSMVRNPTTSVEMEVGMAAGRMYDFSVSPSQPLDTSALDRARLIDLRHAIKENAVGLVELKADVGPSVGFGSRLIDHVVSDADLDDRDSLAAVRMSAMRSEAGSDFKADLVKSFERDHVQLLDKAMDGLVGEGGSMVRPVPSLADWTEAVDRGAYAIVQMKVGEEDRSEGLVRANSVVARFDVLPGEDPLLVSVEVKAERLAEIDGKMVKSHDVTSTAFLGGMVEVEDSRPRQMAALSAQGGRLYAIVDDWHDSEVPFAKVSEVRDGLDGVGLKDLMKTVTAAGGVHDWHIPVVGEVGREPVAVGGVDPKQVDDHSRVTHARLAFLDAAVGEFRRENGHHKGLLSQAGGVRRDVGAPSGATLATKGPEKAEAPGLMDRMRSLVGGREDR